MTRLIPQNWNDIATRVAINFLVFVTVVANESTSRQLKSNPLMAAGYSSLKHWNSSASAAKGIGIQKVKSPGQQGPGALEAGCVRHRDHAHVDDPKAA